MQSPRLRHRFPFVGALVLATVIAGGAGCSSQSSSPSAAPPSAGASADVDAGATPSRTPTFHFVVARDGAQSEVSTIYFTDRFVTRLDGLPSGAEVTVRAHFYTPDAKGKGYTSSAVFVADAAGVVDMGTMAPLRGTYTEVDPDGLFWSMLPEPLAEGLGPDRAAAFFDAAIDGIEVAKASLARTFMAENVRVREVTTDGLVGVYYAPKGATNKVPIVAFGGSEGGLGSGEYLAARFSAEGHPTLGLAYFGAKGVPSELDSVPLEYFEKAFAWLDRQSETAKGKVVVTGGSRGGELALQLGATFGSVVGVIAETPSTYRWAGLGFPTGPAWTYKGEPLEYVGSAGLVPPTVAAPGGARAYVLRETFVDSIASAKPTELERGRIRVEDTKGSILMLGGGDDNMWPACDFMKVGMDKLHETGHAARYGDESVCFSDAGHNIGTLGLPTNDSMWALLGGATYALGGSPRANAHAAREGDDKIRAFLARVAP